MRWFGYAIDPTAGGTTFDDLVGEPAVPTEFVPVQTSQVDPGLNQLERDDEVRGRRGNTQPISFASAPSLTFGARAYPKLVRPLIRRALGGTVSPVGTPPASVESTIQPLQEGNLPALIGHLVREGQTDRLTGLVVDEIELNFPVDEEGTLEVTMPGLYHDVDPTSGVAGLPTPDYDDHVDAFMLRDATAFLGAGAGVEIDCLAGFGFTYNNNLYDDFRSRFCAGRNVQDTTIDGVRHRLWYPERHKIGPQQVTGRIDFSEVRPDRELRRILTHAEKLVFEVAAGPAGTTPAADEMMRLVMYNQVPTGGGAEPLVREGDINSSYEFTAYIDDVTNKDVEAVFVSDAAVA